jgi:hypothetical protein
LESLYGWQSGSMSWCRAHFVDVWPDIASFSRIWVWNLLSCLWGRPLWWEAGSVLCKSQSSHLCVCTFTIYIFVFHTFTIYIYIYIHYTIHNVYTRPLLVLARYSRLCPTTHYLLTPQWQLEKWRPPFPVSGFALSNIVNILVSMILYDFCLLRSIVSGKREIYQAERYFYLDHDIQITN